jgi:hypothetical protein
MRHRARSACRRHLAGATIRPDFRFRRCADPVVRIGLRTRWWRSNRRAAAALRYRALAGACGIRTASPHQLFDVIDRQAPAELERPAHYDSLRLARDAAAGRPECCRTRGRHGRRCHRNIARRLGLRSRCGLAMRCRRRPARRACEPCEHHLDATASRCSRHAVTGGHLRQDISLLLPSKHEDVRLTLACGVDGHRQGLAIGRKRDLPRDVDMLVAMRVKSPFSQSALFGFAISRSLSDGFRTSSGPPQVPRHRVDSATETSGARLLRAIEARRCWGPAK